MNQPAHDLTWQSLGACLAKSRRKQKLELEDVATSLRLPRRTLHAIEQGQCDCLPTVYMKGHVQRYIHLLNAGDASLDGINAEPLFRQRQNAADASGQQPAALLSSALTGTSSGRTFDHALRIASYLIVTAGVVIPLVWWFTQGAVRMSFDESLVSETATSIDTRPISTGPQSTASIRPGHLSASAAPFASMRPRQAGPATEMPMLGGQSMLGSDMAMLNATMEMPIPPYRAATAAPAESGMQQDGTVSGNNNLQLRMLNDSWVEITDVNGNRIEFDLLKTGQLHQYAIDLPLDILIGKASAVDMTLNGELVDLSAHTRGNVAKLTLTASSSAN